MNLTGTLMAFLPVPLQFRSGCLTSGVRFGGLFHEFTTRVCPMRLPQRSREF